MKFRFKTFLICVSILLVDIAVYIVLGLLLMNYDDFYNVSNGEYWSWSSMKTSDQLTIIGLYFWHVVNIGVVSFIIYRTYKLIK